MSPGKPCYYRISFFAAKVNIVHSQSTDHLDSVTNKVEFDKILIAMYFVPVYIV